MPLLLLLVYAAVALVVESWLVMWFTWALTSVGYLSYSLDFSQACTVAAPLVVASVIGLLFSSNT